MLLRDLKLTERHRGSSEIFRDLDLWFGVGSEADLEESADVEVFFDYESPSHTDHPYGMGTAREYHASTASLNAVVLLQDVNRIDENGKVIGVLKRGTDLLKQSWWKDEWSDYLLEKIRDKGDSYNPKADQEPDDIS